MTEFYKHIHHDRLIEPLVDTLENRIRFIIFNKPSHEVETRLRLLQPVRGQLPATVVQAYEAYKQAAAAHNQAWEDYNQAVAAYDQAGNQAGVVHNQAWVAYEQAGVVHSQAVAAYDQARRAYNQAVEDCKQDLEGLHREECPGCPWDGQTIFPSTTHDA